MYERFTDRARKVMGLADQEAHRFDQDHLGTEHILLGLVKEGSGVGANVLKNLDIDLRKTRLEVEKVKPPGPEMVTMGKLPLTPLAMKVIEYATEETRNLNHSYVGTEHLLLGLLREQNSVAAMVLTNLGLKLDEVREEVLKLLGAEGVDPEEPVEATLAEPEELDAPPLVLLLDPGTATPEEIARLLLEFSTLYRMLGGSGITFTKTDARELVFA